MVQTNREAGNSRDLSILRAGSPIQGMRDSPLSMDAALGSSLREVVEEEGGRWWRRGEGGEQEGRLSHRREGKFYRVAMEERQEGGKGKIRVAPT